MNDEQKQAYTARIVEANRSELVVITYELILDALQRAKENAECDKVIYEKELKRAQKLLHELMSSLNYQYELSGQLMRLYVYANKQIIEALTSHVPDTLEEAEKVLSKLSVAFQEVAKQDNSGPVMQNTQKVYAGLTYGKGTLNEISLDAHEANRGFRA